MGIRVHFLLGGTALTVLLQAATGVFGPLGFLIGLLMPLPAAYAGMRMGWQVAGGILLLSSALLVWLTGLSGVAAYVLQYGIPAVLLPFFLGRGWVWDRAAVVSTAVTVGISVLALYSLAVQRGTALAVMIREYVQGEAELALAYWSEANLPADQMAELKHLTDRIADFLVQAWPGLTVLVTGGLFLFIVLVLALAAVGGKYRVPGPPFPQWKAPEPLIWLLILAGAGVLLAGGDWQRAALNLLVVVLPVYFLQGLAIVSFWFRKKNFSPIFRRLGYLLIFIINPLPLVVTGLGVFDLWVDFRKPRVKKA